MTIPVFELSHYIDGKFVTSGSAFEIHYPATNEVIGIAPEGQEDAVDAAVRSAKAAFQTWGKITATQRRPILKAFAEGIRRNADELAHIETWDVGRPISDNGPFYIERVAYQIDFFADFAVTQGSEAYPMDNGYINYVLRQPVGVAALITPWNVPLMLETWKIGPALAFGNTVVLKPSELAPIGAWKLAQIAHEVGIPAGVFNVVHGLGTNSTGDLLTRHPDVKLIAFTGKSATGQLVTEAAAKRLARVSCELSSKSANIVFADADLERAIEVALYSAFYGQGEVCLAAPRILVQRSIYNEFVDRFTQAAAANYRAGDPMDVNTTLGPLISIDHWKRVKDYVDSARQGGEIILGGNRPDLPAPFDKGNFFNATIITGVSPGDAVCQEEIFGPVATIVPFDEEEEAIAMANDVGYGLSAVLQTSNVGRALRVAAALNVGTVWVNDNFVRDLRVPYGGMKASGLGRGGGQYSMEFYTDVKTICLSNQ